jgi:hypothetical protein
MAEIDGTTADYTGAGTADTLTYVMVLHPVAAVFAFIAFVIACLPGVASALCASLTTALAWLITLVVMACDFALWGVCNCFSPFWYLPYRFNWPCFPDHQGSRQQGWQWKLGHLLNRHVDDSCCHDLALLLHLHYPLLMLRPPQGEEVEEIAWRIPVPIAATRTSAHS